MAKGLGGGMPLSAVCGRAEVMDAPPPGGLGGTYAGNPLAVAAALEVVQLMRDGDLPARGAALGERLRRHLEALRPRVPELADVRGLGAMVAAEFRHPGENTPHPEFTRQIQARALEKNLLLLSCGVDGNVIRFLFPLTIGDDTMTEAMDILAQVLPA